MWNLRLGTLGVWFLAGVVGAPLGAAAPPKTAYPGTLNYVEGKVSIGSQTVGANEIGSARLEPQQTLTTEQGKAEVLLTPGVFLRVGDDSSVLMISPNLTDTELAVNHGEATVEVASIYPQNRLIVDEGTAKTQLLKTGFYDFNADQGQVKVFSGKAELQNGDRRVTIKGGHEITLDNPNLKAQSFDKKASENDLYQWSSLRSSYLAQANSDMAPEYYINGYWGPGWFGAGWYWDPWFGGFTFLPAEGIFYSPFGWGFYSPYVVGGWGWGWPYYSGGHYYHHFDSHAMRSERFSPAWGGPRGAFDRGGTFHAGAAGGFRGGSAGGGFHGGAAGGFNGGGFSGGGFHGGGGGGFGHR
jgi:hypothetical protein